MTGDEEIEMESDAGDVLTVSQVTSRLKSVIEEAFAGVWIRGEISNLRKPGSGHLYFSLKDSGSQMPSVMFRGAASKLSIPLEDGMQVLAYGRIGVYEPHGRYQLTVSVMLDDGQGALRRAFDKLKQKLETEGLFDDERKRELPRLPLNIGVITSPSGAALEDFISVLKRREWGGRVVIIPSRVQGVEAKDELVAGIEAGNRMSDLDLLVMTRGGGSLEDLWPFNEEVVARAVAASALPVISAVGHEIDVTLSDYVCDRRAETPTAAAEMISSLYLDVIDEIEGLGEMLYRNTSDIIVGLKERLQLLGGRHELHSPERHLERLYITVDELTMRMLAATREQTHACRNRLLASEQKLYREDPANRVKLLKQEMAALGQRLGRSVRQDLKGRRLSLGSLEKRLDGSSLNKTLARGFAVVRDNSGRFVKKAAELSTGDIFQADFADGCVKAKVEDKGS